MGFIRIFLIFLLIYFVFKILFRMIFSPSQNEKRFYEDRSRKEGDVIVENRSPEDKKVSDKEGEYVDYEEID